MADPPYQIVFYEDAAGEEPARKWIKDDLDATQRRAIGVAMHEILAHKGVAVCETEWGKPLGEGLYEFRVRHSAEEILGPRAGLGKRLVEKIRGKILLRVFFHPYGDKLILLLGGYDKGRFSGKKRQDKEIATARQRLQQWREKKRD